MRAESCEVEGLWERAPEGEKGNGSRQWLMNERHDAETKLWTRMWLLMVTMATV